MRCTVKRAYDSKVVTVCPAWVLLDVETVRWQWGCGIDMVGGGESAVVSDVGPAGNCSCRRRVVGAAAATNDVG